MSRVVQVLLLTCLLTKLGQAQVLSGPAAVPDSAKAPESLTLYGFVDGYYGYDFVGRELQRPFFIYSHNRANEFAVNNALVGLRFDDNRVRGVVALHAGTYVEANYAAEPQVLKHIFEAYAGFRPFGKAWVDVGTFTSHIGFESAISKDNWTLTRSMMAENSPYYESGARCTYEATPQLTVTGLVLNGWQNQRENNRAKALGTQVQWKPTPQLLLNSSTFYGNEQPADSARRRRYFHNFYLSYEATDKLSLALVFDAGLQEAAQRGGAADTWHTGAAFVRYRFTQQWAATARAEYYRAQRGVVVRSTSPAATDANFRVTGASINLDYAPTERVLCRLEARLLRSPNRLFGPANQPAERDYANLTSSIAVSF